MVFIETIRIHRFSRIQIQINKCSFQTNFKCQIFSIKLTFILFLITKTFPVDSDSILQTCQLSCWSQFKSLFFSSRLHTWITVKGNCGREEGNNRFTWYLPAHHCWWLGNKINVPESRSNNREEFHWNCRRNQITTDKNGNHFFLWFFDGRSFFWNINFAVQWMDSELLSFRTATAMLIIVMS